MLNDLHRRFLPSKGGKGLAGSGRLFVFNTIRGWLMTRSLIGPNRYLGAALLVLGLGLLGGGISRFKSGPNATAS